MNSEYLLHITDLNIHKLLESSGESLNFALNEWCLKIQLPEEILNQPSQSQILVLVVYQTKKASRSVHWRQDKDGHPCVYTAVASINNRGLFPCQVCLNVSVTLINIVVIQDVPGAMSTWTVVISLGKEQSHNTVLCTGEEEAELSSDDDLYYHKFSHTSFVLPMSTFALAIGKWSVITISGNVPLVRFIGEFQCLYCS